MPCLNEVETLATCIRKAENAIKEHGLAAEIIVADNGSTDGSQAAASKLGVTVIDVGVNRVDDPSTKKGYRLVGDVQFAEAKQVAGAITPVPGGVGPMTITMLLYNTVQAARQWAKA